MPKISSLKIIYFVWSKGGRENDFLLDHGFRGEGNDFNTANELIYLFTLL